MVELSYYGSSIGWGEILSPNWKLNPWRTTSHRGVVLQDDVIKWKHFPSYWPFVRGIHRSPVNSPHKGQWRGALMFSLISSRINGWANNREAGDFLRHCANFDVIVMHNLKRNPSKFEDTIKPYMANKSRSCNENITLKRNGTIANNPNDVCDIFNGYFTNVALESEVKKLWMKTGNSIRYSKYIKIMQVL